MKNKNIKDVAEYAGVSVTTISRVLNKKGYISDEMYKKVYDAMEAIDYQPNQIARSLTGKRTNTIAFLLPFVSYPFFFTISRKSRDGTLSKRIQYDSV
ncbi:MAG: LacI family DNA-binding transcriptional regulator [Anaerolineales bacterium]|nr:LacI family DNA-binding transcriptional regulator [Anaerolineales bacterium]